MTVATSLSILTALFLPKPCTRSAFASCMKVRSARRKTSRRRLVSPLVGDILLCCCGQHLIIGTSFSNINAKGCRSSRSCSTSCSPGSRSHCSRSKHWRWLQWQAWHWHPIAKPVHHLVAPGRRRRWSPIIGLLKGIVCCAAVMVRRWLPH